MSRKTQHVTLEATGRLGLIALVFGPELAREVLERAEVIAAEAECITADHVHAAVDALVDETRDDMASAGELFVVSVQILTGGKE